MVGMHANRCKKGWNMVEMLPAPLAADLASEQSSSSSNISFTAMAETAVCLEVCGLPSMVFKLPNDLKMSELKAQICPEDWPDAILLQNGRQGPSLFHLSAPSGFAPKIM